MLYFTVGAFALAAIFGITILVRWMSKKAAPKGVIFTHGILAAAGLGALVVYALQNPGNFPKAGLILLAAAALGGFYLFYKDFFKKTQPVPVAIIHAMLAVSGFIALLMFVFV